MLDIPHLLVVCEKYSNFSSPSPVIVQNDPKNKFYCVSSFDFPFPISYSEIFISYSVLFSLNRPYIG